MSTRVIKTVLALPCYPHWSLDLLLEPLLTRADLYSVRLFVINVAYHDQRQQ